MHSPIASLLLAAACLSATLAHADTSATPLPLIPQPAQLQRQAGSFVVNAKVPIVVAGNDQGARQVADYLSAELTAAGGPTLDVRTGETTASAIVFRRLQKPPLGKADGYVLDVSPNGIRIEAADDAGLFYGAVTLWQLLGDKAGSVPAVHIEDAPRFAWRGLMLDSARHFQTPDEIRGLIDQMALHKLNVLHWHLTDDQGWRIEIKRYPQLTRIGAWRTPPAAGVDGEPARYGGFYTQAQIRDLVAYAAARHITIVPELDLPGHAQAAVASYPELGVTGTRPSVSVDWGVNPYLYNVDEHTITFLHDVLDEVMALFPSTYIHLGGDEAIKDQWQAAPAIQAKIHALGLKNEDALQSWMIENLGQYLAAHGRRLVGWDEILEGGVPSSATVMSWRGSQGAIDAARQGHDVVLSPSPDLYFDSIQSTRDDEFTGRLPAMTLKHVYDFEAVPKALNAEQARHVLGLQANIWTEHQPTITHVQHAVFPRLDAVAEAAWTPPSQRQWRSFVARLPAQFARYHKANIAVADTAFAPTVEIDRNAALATGKATVRLSNEVNAGELHYTLDGSEPSFSAPRYTQPFTVTLPTTVRVATYDAQGQSLAASRERVLDASHLLSRSSGELVNCPGSDFTLRTQPMPDATSIAPAYDINVFDACRIYRQARLDGVVGIDVDVARLPRNYALAHDAKLVKSHAASSKDGELVVHRDGCEGPVLATLPLPPAAVAPRRFSLQGKNLPANGVHDLCLIFTAPIDGPLYAIGRFSLKTGDARP